MAISASPQIAYCYFDEGFDPHLAAMSLCWPTNVATVNITWKLPETATIEGPPPERFGITIHRWKADAYETCLLWNEKRFRWSSLTRAQLLGSALETLVAAIGGDLRYYLDQPIVSETSVQLKAS